MRRLPEQHIDLGLLDSRRQVEELRRFLHTAGASSTATVTAHVREGVALDVAVRRAARLAQVLTRQTDVKVSTSRTPGTRQFRIRIERDARGWLRTDRKPVVTRANSFTSACVSTTIEEVPNASGVGAGPDPKGAGAMSRTKKQIATSDEVLRDQLNAAVEQLAGIHAVLDAAAQTRDGFVKAAARAAHLAGILAGKADGLTDAIAKTEAAEVAVAIKVAEQIKAADEKAAKKAAKTAKAEKVEVAA